MHSATPYVWNFAITSPSSNSLNDTLLPLKSIDTIHTEDRHHLLLAKSPSCQRFNFALENKHNYFQQANKTSE